MFVLITYDVENDKLRDRIARLLEGHGRRVQWSVFECHLTEAQLGDLRERLEQLTQPSRTSEVQAGSYSIRIYRLCKACARRITVIGEGDVSEDEAFYLV